MTDGDWDEGGRWARIGITRIRSVSFAWDFPPLAIQFWPRTAGTGMKSGIAKAENKSEWQMTKESLVGGAVRNTNPISTLALKLGRRQTLIPLSSVRRW
jgi:hypothetical protein